MSGLMRTLMRKGNAMHVALYRRTGGRHFNRVRGLPVCLLTVPGRKTGTPRTTPMAYFERAGSWLVVGSAGGAKAGAATAATTTDSGVEDGREHYRAPAERSNDTGSDCGV